MVHKNEIDAGGSSPSDDATRAASAAAPHDSPGARGPVRRGWLRRAVHVVVPVCVIALVARELTAVDWHRAALEITHAEPVPIVWAACATVACLVNMGFYDVLALQHGSRLSGAQRWTLGAAICSWTNFLAIGPLAGPALRLHFYRRAGMDLLGVVRGLGGIYAAMFTGIAAWIAAVYMPLPESALDEVVRTAIAIGLAPLLCMFAGALIYRVRRNAALDNPRTYAALGIVGALEWGLVATVYTLVGRSLGVEAPVAAVAKSFFVGHVAGAASLLPGGLGSADTVWLKMNLAQGSPASVAAAQVLLFRCVYFLWPWGLSLCASIAYFLQRWLRKPTRRGSTDVRAQV